MIVLEITLNCEHVLCIISAVFVAVEICTTAK